MSYLTRLIKEYDKIYKIGKIGKIAMDPIVNPYAPGAGSQPPELAGRDHILERARITLGRIKGKRHAKSFLLVGLRGVGKTVLLNKIEDKAKDLGFRTAPIEAAENKSLPELLVPPLRRILLGLNYKEKVDHAVKRGLSVLAAFANAAKMSIGELEFGLNIDPNIGVADTGDLDTDLPALFAAIGEAAQSRGTAVAIIADELQYVKQKEFSSLIMAMHVVSQKRYPVVLIGAGLPQLVALAGKAKSYAERLFDYPVVGPLKTDDAIKAIYQPAHNEGVEYEADAIFEILTVTEGYPYFLQEWGYQCWLAADLSPITLDDVQNASIAAIESLDESFFRVRFDRVTPREKEYLFAMSEIGTGPHRSGEIAMQLGVAVESVAPTRRSLINKGMVFSPSHGDTAFTVPMFDRYLRRLMGFRS